MLNVGLFKAFAPAAIAGLAACSYASSTFVQPKVEKLLSKAETALYQGSLSECEANLNAAGFGRKISVYVDSEQINPARKDEVMSALGEAMAWWNEAAGQEVLVFGLKEKADVKVKVVDAVRFESQHVAGLAVWTRNVGRLGSDSYFATLRADIEVRELLPSGETMSKEAMRHTFAHELGHVIGLDDCPKRGGVMGPLDINKPALELGEQDLMTLNTLRQAGWRVSLALNFARILTPNRAGTR